jgi:hypothetical protein
MAGGCFSPGSVPASNWQPTASKPVLSRTPTTLKRFRMKPAAPTVKDETLRTFNNVAGARSARVDYRLSSVEVDLVAAARRLNVLSKKSPGFQAGLSSALAISSPSRKPSWACLAPASRSIG